MRETRPSGSVEGVMSNRDPYSDSTRAFLVGKHHQVYSGIGAGVVMESISLTELQKGEETAHARKIRRLLSKFTVRNKDWLIKTALRW
jgi:hypothetical protein